MCRSHAIECRPPYSHALFSISLSLSHPPPQWLDWSADLRGAVSSVTRRHFTAVEARAAKYAFAMGTSLKLAPIVRWDGAYIGDGSPGLPVLVLKELMEADMDPVTEGAAARFTTVPFNGLGDVGGEYERGEGEGG